MTLVASEGTVIPLTTVMGSAKIVAIVVTIPMMPFPVVPMVPGKTTG